MYYFLLISFKIHICNFICSVPDDPETEVDEEIDNLLTTDFEIGHYIRERIIPRAVLYFTGIIYTS